MASPPNTTSWRGRRALTPQRSTPNMPIEPGIPPVRRHAEPTPLGATLLPDMALSEALRQAAAEIARDRAKSG